jgi:hypothetical protein
MNACQLVQKLLMQTQDRQRHKSVFQCKISLTLRCGFFTVCVFSREGYMKTNQGKDMEQDGEYTVGSHHPGSAVQSQTDVCCQVTSEKVKGWSHSPSSFSASLSCTVYNSPSLSMYHQLRVSQNYSISWIEDKMWQHCSASNCWG